MSQCCPGSTLARRCALVAHQQCVLGHVELGNAACLEVLGVSRQPVCSVGGDVLTSRRCRVPNTEEGCDVGGRVERTLVLGVAKVNDGRRVGRSTVNAAQ